MLNFFCLLGRLVCAAGSSEADTLVMQNEGKSNLHRTRIMKPSNLISFAGVEHKWIEEQDLPGSFLNLHACAKYHISTA